MRRSPTPNPPSKEAQPGELIVKNPEVNGGRTPDEDESFVFRWFPICPRASGVALAAARLPPSCSHKEIVVRVNLLLSRPSSLWLVLGEKI